MGKKLVLAGGGHAHMMLLANIDSISASGHSVTVVQPSDYHYYSGMGPGMLSGFYSPEDIRFHTKHVVEKFGGRFIKDRVVKIEPEKQYITLESDERITYDVLSCNTGSFIPFPFFEGTNENVFTAKPIERLLEAQKSIINLCQRGHISIAIVGGGPAAVELAGTAHQLAIVSGCNTIEVEIFAGKTLMKNFPDKVRRHLYEMFAKRKIRINETGYVRSISNGKILMETKTQYEPDIIFVATGVQPSTLFEDSGLSTGPNGGLRVNAHLQCIDYPHIFGGGDCIYFTDQPLNKVGVYAVRENPVLLNNIVADLEGHPLMNFNPGGGYLLIFNLGDGTGVLQKGPFIWRGRIAFFIKNYIDRKFMKQFQSYEG